MKILYFCLAVLMVFFVGCATSKSDNPKTSIRASECIPKGVSFEMGAVFVEKASGLTRRERRDVCGFVQNLCIDVKSAPCPDGQNVCIAFLGRDEERMCSVVQVQADFATVAYQSVYHWVASLFLGS